VCKGSGATWNIADDGGVPPTTLATQMLK